VEIALSPHCHKSFNENSFARSFRFLRRPDKLGKLKLVDRGRRKLPKRYVVRNRQTGSSASCKPEKEPRAGHAGRRGPAGAGFANHQLPAPLFARETRGGSRPLAPSRRSRKARIHADMMGQPDHVIHAGVHELESDVLLAGTLAKPQPTRRQVRSSS